MKELLKKLQDTEVISGKQLSKDIKLPLEEVQDNELHELKSSL